MQQQPYQSRPGTRETPLAAPLCVLLAQLQSLAGGQSGSRDLLGANPLASFLLAYQVAAGRTTADRQGLLSQLLNPDPLLLQELLVARLSRRAVLATADSEERLLQDWQRQQQCWLLTTIAARLLNLPDPQSAGLASVYCLLDQDIAAVLPVPSLWTDLRDTVHAPADDLRDTALLSRLVWCCHRLQRNQLRLDDALVTACTDLLGWQEPRLRALAEETQVALLQRSKALGVSAGLDQLQKDAASGEHWLQEVKLQAVRAMVQTGQQRQASDSPADLHRQLQCLLLRHQLPLQYWLLSARAQADRLRLVSGDDANDLDQQIDIPLAGSRSMLASLVQQNTVARLRTGDAGLAPVDKQLLRLCGCESLLCLPIAGEPQGALLLPDASPDNPELAALARSVQQLLATAPPQAAAVGVSEDVVLMQQQVRELVHEVNNPLAIIKNYLRLLQLKYPNESSAREEIGHIDGEIDRIARLLQSLRHSVTATHETVELDLNDAVRSQHKWLVAAFGGRPGLTLDFTPAPEPAVVQASPAALTQILLNLVKNAAEALGENGKIRLTIKRNVHLLGRLHVVLEVSDDGPGLESWQMQKLFQGLGSTKQGTHRGNGLAVVKKLVDELQGQISCHSDKNGTTFSLLLPQVR